MKLPFHGVQVCGDILFAARGGNIHSFNSDGAHISCWKYPAESKDATKNGHSDSTPAPQDDQGPPAKRMKLDNEEPQVRKKGQPKKPGPMSQPSDRPMVILMTATSGGDASHGHVIIVTSDKSIWVFEHDGRGGLKQLSRRTMPKRPCSIVLTPDNKDILAADKFGDVYSLPLIPSDNEPSQATATTTAAPAQETASSPAPGDATASPSPAPEPTTTTTTTTNTAAISNNKHFTPQATPLTVHTKRNRRALLDQQVSLTNPKAMGGTPKRVNEVFERHLLLGHVSLLTAIALGHDEQGRRYIITADRDEHIRVSRGTREQAHVIERYCLGHEEFVHRLLIPEGGKGDVLISAGGDEDVFVWRWREGTLLGRADLIGRVKKVVEGVEKIAVTGLCCWPGNDGKETRIAMICERVPAIFLFNMNDKGDLEPSATIDLPGNPFDIGVDNAQSLIIPVDPTDKAEDGTFDVKKSLLRVTHADGEYKVLEDVIQHATELEAETPSVDDVSSIEMEKLLYSAETLRKSNFEDREDGDGTKIEQEG